MKMQNYRQTKQPRKANDNDFANRTPAPGNMNMKKRTPKRKSCHR
jgi:hypothetical protein